MAKGKSTRTKEDTQIQKHRTAKNKIRKYEKLIAERPNDIHAKVWISVLDKQKAVLI